MLRRGEAGAERHLRHRQGRLLQQRMGLGQADLPVLRRAACVAKLAGERAAAAGAARGRAAARWRSRASGSSMLLLHQREGARQQRIGRRLGAAAGAGLAASRPGGRCAQQQMLGDLAGKGRP